MQAPEKLKPNEILRQHGPAGWLIVRLQRYALTGWIAFFALLCVFVLLVFVSTLAPRPVVAVDAAGRVLGQMEYLDPANRSDAEIIAGAERFLDDYLSLNSATIFEDYAAALNMMTPGLRKATLAALQRTLATADGDYLARVRAAQTRSRVRFSDTPSGARILTRHGSFIQVRIAGRIHVIGSDNHESVRPFDTTLTVAIVARTSNDTAGLEVAGITDN
ncbi:MAG: hypothetical protein ACYDDO_04730 [Acidiferrobacterales bacterium]